MKPGDLARRAFESMKDDEGEEEETPSKPEAPDAGEAAGRRLKSALESGKGIKAAFRAMMDECGDYTESEE